MRNENAVSREASPTETAERENDMMNLEKTVMLYNAQSNRTDVCVFRNDDFLLTNYL